MGSCGSGSGSTDVCNPLPTRPDGRASPRRRILSRFLSDRRGETAIEYGLIASLVVVAILTALSQFSTANNKLYNKIVNAMSTTP